MIKKTTLQKRKIEEKKTLAELRNNLIKYVLSHFQISYRQTAKIFGVTSQSIYRIANNLPSHPERKRAKNENEHK